MTIDITTLPAGIWTPQQLANDNTYNHRVGRFTPETSEAYEAANVGIVNGNLVLAALQQNADGMAYTSGAIDTLNKQSWKYGTFTFTAWVPSDANTSAGLWPAIWMLPADGSNGFEIDVMECINDAPGRFYCTLHDYVNNYSDTTACTAMPSFDGFHTFTLIWQPTLLEFIIDNHIVASYTSHIPQAAAYLIIDFAVGVNAQWQPAPPPSSLVLPAYFVMRSFTYAIWPTPVVTPPALVTDTQAWAAAKTLKQWLKQ